MNMVRKLVRKKKKKNFLLKIIIVVLIAVGLDLSWYMFGVDIAKYKNKNPDKTAFMKYRESKWAEKNRKVTIKKIWMPLSRISENAQRAVIVAEDAKFWKHDGFDFDAMRMAFEKNLEKRKMAVGASTISMQVAKNLYLSPSKTPIRKIHEAIITWRMERVLSKKRILEIYLNIAEWGDGIFGIEAASHAYFNHGASTLDRHESALLASVLPNPIRFSPLKNSRYVARRSRLIQKALGGDFDAAIELHTKSMSNANKAEDTLKDNIQKQNDSVEIQSLDSSELIDSLKPDSLNVNDSVYRDSTLQ